MQKWIGQTNVSDLNLSTLFPVAFPITYQMDMGRNYYLRNFEILTGNSEKSSLVLVCALKCILDI